MNLINNISKRPKLFIASLSVAMVSVLALLSMPKNSISSEKLVFDVVEVGDLDIYAEGFGHFAALDNYTVTAPFTGVIESVHKRSGDFVKKGETLMILTNRDVVSSLMSETNNLANAELELARLRQEMEADIQDQSAKIAIEETKLKLSKMTLEAKEKLADSGVVSGLEIAQARMDDTLAQQSLETEKNRLIQLKQRAMQKQQLQIQKIRLAQSFVDERQKDLDALTLRAPDSGILAELDAQVGDSASFGQKLGQVKGDQNFAVIAKFPQHLSGKLELDTLVQVSFLGQTLKGQVKRILPGVVNGFIQTEVRLDEHAQNIVEDLEVNIKANVNTLPDVKYVKRPSGLLKGKRANVFKVKGDRAQKVEVAVEAQEGPYMIVTDDTLQAGDQIIVSNTSAFSDQSEIYIR